VLKHTHAGARAARMRSRTIITTAATIAAAAALAGPAQAALTPSANDANTTLPATFTDSTDGLVLEPCSNTGCAIPGPRPDLNAPLAVPGNFDPSGEAFWFYADAQLPGGFAEFALEAAFLLGDPAPDEGSAFSRIRIRLDNLTGHYRITHPYGSKEYDAAGGTRSINDSIDIGCNPTATTPCDYQAADYGTLTSFLRPAAGLPTTGGAVSNTVGPVVGAPTGYNGVKIEKQVPVTLENPSGWQLVAEQLNFNVQAQIAGAPAAPVPFISTTTRSIDFAGRRADEISATRTVTVKNDGAAPLNISGVTLIGPDEASFTATGCAGTSVAPGASCNVSVGFVAGTPVGSHTATLAIASNAANTPTLNIALGARVTGLAPAPQQQAPPAGTPATGGGGAAATTTIVRVIPGAGAAAPSNQAVQGVVAKPLAVSGLTLAQRISITRLRAQGLRITMRVQADTKVVRVAVYRAKSNGNRTGTALFAGYQAASKAGLVRITLRGSLPRRLRTGQYVVEVQPGQSRTSLGTLSRHRFRVTR
jgi:hypothetical protein